MVGAVAIRSREENALDSMAPVMPHPTQPLPVPATMGPIPTPHR